MVFYFLFSFDAGNAAGARALVGAAAPGRPIAAGEDGPGIYQKTGLDVDGPKS